MIAHLLIVTGCRRGKIIGLKWNKVDLEKAVLEISANVCYSKQPGIYETSTKTRTVRFLKIPNETVALLKRYRVEQAEQRIKCGDRWIDTGYLVASVLIANGTDIVTVSKQLGHAQVSTTSDRYSHPIDRARAEASECIANALLIRKKA